MNERQLELAMRHGALRARSAEQRRQLAQHAEPLAAMLAKGDRALEGVDWLKRHPAAVGVAAAVLVILKPARAWRWGRRAFVLWRGWGTLRSHLLHSLNSLSGGR